MESYLLKSSISLLIFYLLYRIILHHEASSQIKRFVGLTCVLFSTSFLLIPSFSLFPAESYPVVVQSVVETSSTFQRNFSDALPKESFSIFLIIYFAGVAVFFLRFLVGMLSLLRLSLSSKKMSGNGFIVMAVKKKVSPFTFFNLLFIQEDDLEKQDLRALIAHEQVHRDQFHTIDTLVLQFFTILYWFNPAMWLFQKDIRAQHEFIADDEVLKKGFDRLKYQDMLFQEQTGVSFQSVNYLSNKTSLKQRFNMMEKTKFNTKSSYFKTALFLPLMAIAVLISSFSPSIVGDRGDFATPTFKVFTDVGEVDLKKGIPKETTRLFVRAMPTDDKGMAYRISETELIHISKGQGLGSIKSGERIDLSALFDSKKPKRGDLLLLTIDKYQSRNANKQVETVVLKEKVLISIPVK